MSKQKEKKTLEYNKTNFFIIILILLNAIIGGIVFGTVAGRMNAEAVEVSVVETETEEAEEESTEEMKQAEVMEPAPADEPYDFELRDLIMDGLTIYIKNVKDYKASNGYIVVTADVYSGNGNEPAEGDLQQHENATIKISNNTDVYYYCESLIAKQPGYKIECAADYFANAENMGSCVGIIEIIDEECTTIRVITGQ